MDEEKKPTYYELNKERIKEQARKNHAKNRKKRLKQMRNYYRKDPKGFKEKYDEYQKSYRARPEVKKRRDERKKIWDANNADRIKEYSRKHNTKKRLKRLEERGLA